MAGMRDDDPLYSALALRQKFAGDQDMQNLLGPVEHKQFLQEVTKTDPLLGTILLAAAPAYTGLKALGINVSDDKTTLTSAPSMDEIFAALDGYLRGLGL